MAGNQSAISICSNALVLLGAEPISDFTSNDAGTVSAANLFPNTYLEFLQGYDWNFAKVQRTLSRDPQIPLLDFKNKFALPADLLRVINTSERKYDIVGDYIYADSDSISLTYVAQVDINKAPIYFTNALEYFMASKLAIPVTGDLDKMSVYSQMASASLKKARHIDSRQTPAQDVVSKPFIEVRG